MFRHSIAPAWPRLILTRLLPPRREVLRLRPGVILPRCADAPRRLAYPVPPPGVSLRLRFVLALPFPVLLQQKRARLPPLREKIPPPGGLLPLFGCHPHA